MTAPPIDWHLRDLKYQGANTVDLYQMTTIEPSPEYL